ncbi:MAG: phosphonate ABC transporter, permease protein PhnE [Cyanobacteria bacterium J06642_2]
MVASPVIEVEHLHKSFRGKPALQGVSFRASQGEMLALVGASGSGKSTLLRNMNGLQTAERGTIKVLGSVVQSGDRLSDRIRAAMRAISELVFALIFVVAVGLGPFAGVLALAVHTAGTLGKLFSEAVEASDPGPVKGIRATGASKLQEIIFGVIPQVMPLWASFTLYRFESNVRSASVLGIVGAGGIGVSLYQSFGSFEYRRVCAILIILIVATGLVDTLSSQIRKRLL